MQLPSGSKEMWLPVVCYIVIIYEHHNIPSLVNQTQPLLTLLTMGIIDDGECLANCIISTCSEKIIRRSQNVL